MKNAEDDKKYFIYAILQDISGSVYIHYASEKSRRFVYKDHMAEKSACTKALFQEFKDAENEISRPKMYSLAGDIYKTDRFAHKLAWIRYFLDHSFTLLNDRYEVTYAGDLRDEALAIYESIKDIPLSEVVSADNETARDFKSRKNVSTEPVEKRISTRVTVSEHAKVKENADELGMSISAYIKTAALNPQIVIYNYESITEHIKELKEIKGMLLPLVSMLFETRNVYQADINKLITLLQGIDESEKRMLRNRKKERDRIRRRLSEGSDRK